MSQSPRSPHIVLISGWALPVSVMDPLASALDKANCCVSVIELPGLAQVNDLVSGRVVDWEVLMAYLDQQIIDKPAVLVGWSMGGVLASIYASRNPDKASAVVNLAVNACFVKSEQWATAITPELFCEFQDGILKNCPKTLRKFTLLCSLGSVNQRELAKTLQALFQETDVVLKPVILKALLTLLSESDIRSELADITCPVSHMLGQDDALIPVEVTKVLSDRYPEHRVQSVEGGHCFFMDDPSLVVREIQTVCSFV